MNWVFFTLAVITLLSAAGAVSFRNPVHCALSLTLTFAGLAAFYLHLNAQFVGLAQILVYVGAVAILIVFAILLTRGAESGSSERSRGAWIGFLIAIGTFVALCAVILSSGTTSPARTPADVNATVHQLGDKLLKEYVLPLEVIGLLLTAAMIGAALIAMQESSGRSRE